VQSRVEKQSLIIREIVVIAMQQKENDEILTPE
jgi:hypothetical protein